MTVCFISGHIDLTQDEFDSHYKDRILKSIQENASFVVGDANGCDAMAQRFLSDCIGGELLPEIDRVRVYHMLKKPRNNVGFRTVGGFKSDEERDAAMTAASDADIAWVRPGREKSGTAKNLRRRANKDCKLVDEIRGMF